MYEENAFTSLKINRKAVKGGEMLSSFFFIVWLPAWYSRVIFCFNIQVICKYIYRRSLNIVWLAPVQSHINTMVNTEHVFSFFSSYFVSMLLFTLNVWCNDKVVSSRTEWKNVNNALDFKVNPFQWNKNGQFFLWT